GRISGNLRRSTRRARRWRPRRRERDEFPANRPAGIASRATAQVLLSVSALFGAGGHIVRRRAAADGGGLPRPRLHRQVYFLHVGRGDLPVLPSVWLPQHGGLLERGETRRYARAAVPDRSARLR